MKSAVELFQAGSLREAIELATAAVKAKPMEIAGRSILAELLSFSGDLERADKQLEAALLSDPKSMPGISLMRHLIRSEITRKEVFEQGRVPEFIETPGPSQQKRLQALIALREGNPETAASLIAEALESAPDLKGSVNGRAFEGFCDLDDLLGTNFEVFTATGAYYWIEASQIVSLTFESVSHITDMLWRSAAIETRGNLQGRVHIPALYFGSSRSEDPKIQIGRTTDWIQNAGCPVRGLGQREFLMGEEPVTVMEIEHLSFELCT